MSLRYPTFQQISQLFAGVARKTKNFLISSNQSTWMAFRILGECDQFDPETDCEAFDQGGGNQTNLTENALAGKHNPFFWNRLQKEKVAKKDQSRTFLLQSPSKIYSKTGEVIFSNIFYFRHLIHNGCRRPTSTKTRIETWPKYRRQVRIKRVGDQHPLKQGLKRAYLGAHPYHHTESETNIH